MDDVFSVTNVELIDAGASPSRRRGRGRPAKIPKHPEKPDKPVVASPARRIPRAAENGDVLVSLPGLGDVSGVTELPPVGLEGVERVVLAMDAIVKVFCVHTEPNFSLPWQRKRQASSNSSGFIIAGRRVLTNAHSVEHYTQVKLKKRGSDTKYLATVLAIGTECDMGMVLSLIISIRIDFFFFFIMLEKY